MSPPTPGPAAWPGYAEAVQAITPAGERPIHHNPPNSDPRFIFSVDGQIINIPTGPVQDGREIRKRIREEELQAFAETIPESIRPHLTEADIEREYLHHYGKI